MRAFITPAALIHVKIMATAQILTTITIDAPAQEVSLHKIDCCDFIMMIDLVRFVRIEKGAAAVSCFKNANKQ